MTVNRSTVSERKRRGWSEVDARTLPAGAVARGPKPTVYTVGEMSHTLREWAEILGVPIKRLRYLTRNDPVGVLTKLAEHQAKKTPTTGGMSRGKGG